MQHTQAHREGTTAVMRICIRLMQMTACMHAFLQTWGRPVVERVVCLRRTCRANAAKSGIAKGDTIIYTSSFFGDELWPADKPGFSRSAINACPSPVCFVYVRTPGQSPGLRILTFHLLPPS